MKIFLNDTTKIDLDKLIESRMLIQANSGGGKSHTIRRIVEQAAGHVQIIVIDPARTAIIKSKRRHAQSERSFV